MITVVPAQTIHVVAPPTILTHGLAISSTWLLADSIQEEGRCLDKGLYGLLQHGCWQIQYKKKEDVWTKVSTDLVGNFRSFSESKLTETSLAANQHFVSSYVHIHTHAH